jgi:ATP/maltotriose-dependent transcriptional regulator MalT/DNA-binding SARP family transcriptional activator
MAKPILAKLTRPRLDGIVARNRLFKVLDQSRDHPATWISGPPGAGKTMLVASYLESRNIPALWYQFDAADADPASLFYYLTEATKRSRGRLPALAPEHQSDLPTFSRNFFRTFFGRLASGSMLVIDGVPSLDIAGKFAQVLLAAIREVPSTRHLIITSRDDIPAQFARSSLQGLIAPINWSDLQLTEQESSEISADIPGIDESVVKTLHKQAGGWMAGLRLLLENYRNTGNINRSDVPRHHDALFGFFAAEIFNQLPEHSQKILLSTCFLPRLSANTIERMTGDARAWQLLAELNQRHMFVDRLDGTPALFQYHNLFRVFLRELAPGVLSPSEHMRLQRLAAKVLVETGQSAHAVPLLVSAGEWASAARLILEQSPQMFARGHYQTMANWVMSLPSWYLATSPRLLYCLGMAQIASNTKAARATLMRASEGFSAEENKLGQALAAAAIIQTYYLEFDDFSNLPRWIDELTKLLSQGMVFPSPDTELHVLSMLQVAMFHARPDHPDLAGYAERVSLLITRDLEPNISLSAAAMLLTYYDFFSPEKARLLVSYVEPLLKNTDVAPFNRIWWLLAAGHHYGFQGNDTRMRNVFSDARAVAEAGGLQSTKILLALVQAHEHMTLGDGDEGALALSKAAELLTPGRRQEDIVFHIVSSEISLLQHDWNHAREHARNATLLARETGSRASEMESLALLAIAHCECGDGNAALEAAKQSRAILGHVIADRIEVHHLLIETYAHLQLGHNDKADALLQRAFSIAQNRGYLYGFVRFPKMLSLLCAEALRKNIETQHTLDIIRRFARPPPSQAVSDRWPWPIRVRVFDSLSVEVNGRLQEASRKAQKKPLELLAALVAKGMNGADRTLLAQELWPDSEGDSAESALRMTLHRLRKILQNDSAVFMQDSKIQLNANIVWVDAWAFELACANVSSVSESMVEDSDESPGTASSLFSLYRGPAFGREAPQPWMLPARERWRTKFIAAVEQIGEREVRRGANAIAETTYKHALDVDPLSEEMYQRLMACHLEQGNFAEAYNVYRRCREMLSIALGLHPSNKTELLRERIVAQGLDENTTNS